MPAKVKLQHFFPVLSEAVADAYSKKFSNETLITIVPLSRAASYAVWVWLN